MTRPTQTSLSGEVEKTVLRHPERIGIAVSTVVRKKSEELTIGWSLSSVGHRFI
jgi:hypothetical protein